MASNLRFLGATAPTTANAAPGFAEAGSDVVVLRLSQDYYREDARFTVSIDGTAVGGTYATSARRADGERQDFAFAGDLGAGPHAVTVDFLNDSYGGTADTDSNLVVERVFLDGTPVPGQGAIQFGPGPIDYALSGASQPDTLLLQVSQDYYLEDARFVVRVDGALVGGVNTVTARRADGATQFFTLTGDFGSGPHRVSIDFLNDHFDPATGRDSNLVVEQVRFNDAVVPDAAAIQFGPGPREFAVPDTAPPPVQPAGPDALVLRLTQDYYLENAQFAVRVDGVLVGGVNTVTAFRRVGYQGEQETQEFTFRGDFGPGPGPHRVSVDFLNDNYGGTSDTDSNLIVVGATFNDVAVPGAPAIQFGPGPREFAVPDIARPLAPVFLTDVAAGRGGFKIGGEASFDEAGTTVAGAGDVNGDGFADLLVGAPSRDEPPPAGSQRPAYDAGAAYLVLGGPARGAVDLDDVAAGNRGLGTRFLGASEGAALGTALSAAGDVNGDGLADFILGAPGASTADGVRAGAAYVVFGRTDGGFPGLDQLAAGVGGFQIRGGRGALGTAAAGAGDVNGDGLADLIVGSDSVVGDVAVVFGRAGGGAVDTNTASADGTGFRLEREGPAPFYNLDQRRWEGLDDFGRTASGAGDVNGDGRADIVVGVPGNDSDGRFDNGSAYVVFGGNGTGTVALGGVGTASGAAGFKIRGGASFDQAGITVAGAGDVNGDGLADVVVGTRSNTVSPEEGAYVVFGKSGSATVDLAGFASGTGTAGFRIVGASFTGEVASAGDVNGDGRADLLVGAALLDVLGNAVNRTDVVVFGKADGAAVDLDRIVAGQRGGGLVIFGENDEGNAAGGVSAAGDVNGDGLADLLVADSFDDGDGETNNGAAYVVYGRADWQV